ncbi:MAG: T9SS type A sorting domain-containing protein [Flavobacteriales bacterium]
MKQIVSVVFFAAIVSANTFAQKYESLITGNGGIAAGQVHSQQMAVAGNGDVFMVTQFNNYFGMQDDTLYTNPFWNDLVMVHFNAQGEYIAMKQLSSFYISGVDSVVTGENCMDIAIDSEDNIYIAWMGGPYYQDADTVYTINGTTWLNGVACFDTDMNFKWHQQVGGVELHVAASSTSSGVYAIGPYDRKHFDTEGNLLWSESSSFLQKAISVADDRMVIAGYGSGGTATEDNVSVDVEWISGGVVFMFDTTATALWAKTYGQNNGNYNEWAHGIVILPETHDVFIAIDQTTGPFDFAGETLMNPTGLNSFIPVLKFDEDGNEIASQIFHSEISTLSLFCMNLTESGEILIGGSRYGNTPGWLGDIYVEMPNTVVDYVAKMDSDLNPVWIKVEQNMSNLAAEAHEIVYLDDGSYFVGYAYWSSNGTGDIHRGCQLGNYASNGAFFCRISNDTEPVPNADFEAVMSGNLFTSEFPHQTEEQLPGMYGSWNFGDGSPWLYQDDVFHPYAEPGVYNVCLSMANNCGSNEHCEVVSYSGLRAIEPYIGGQGVVSVLVLGGGFTEGTTFKLSRDGEADIIPSLITVGNEATIFGRLNLTNATLGEWNVVAEIPGEEADTLFNAFIVEVLRPAEVQLDIFGAHVARLQTWSQKIVRVSNVGNEDAVLVPLHIELPLSFDLWLFAEAIDRHSVAGNEGMNDAFDNEGGDFDVLTMTDSLYQIKRVNLTIPFIGANSYVEYRVWLKGDVYEAYMTALAFPPLISSLALVDATVVPASSPFIQQFQETAEWVYEEDFNFEAILPSYQEVIMNYAQSIGQTVGGTGGWPIGSLNPTLPNIGGIGFFNLNPIISQPPSYSTTPIWIGPPLIGINGPGTTGPVNPPQPPVVSAPPPPPITPSPEQCAFNGCCTPECFVEIEDIVITDDQIIVEMEDGTIVIIEIDEEGVEVTDEFDLSYEDYLEYLEEIEGEGGSGNEGPDRPDYISDDDEDFSFVIDEDDAVVWDGDGDGDGEEGGGCMDCDNSSGEDDGDGGGSNGSEGCTGCDGGPGGQGPGGGAGGGGEGGTGNGGGASGEDEDGGEDEKKVPFKVITGIDPNAIYGPMRNGDIYLNNVRDHAFTITFENLAEATAAAQTVIVRDTLDTEKFDVHSLRFVNATVADSLLINMEPGVWNANYMVSLTEDLYLNVTTQFDTVTGIIRWEFNSIDPATMSLTQDPFAGFLPPNMNGTEGTGSVSYVVNFRSATLDGDVINNRAEILFDLNEPIMTNTHTNILDFTAPQSEVEELPAVSVNEFITLQLTGSDNIAGIAYYHVFVSINNHPYVLYKTTAHNEIPFRGIVGRTYKFFSMAVDKAGNIEATPEDPRYDFDTQITFITSVNEIVLSSSLKVFPNPTADVLFLAFTLTQNADVKLNLVNVLGENVSLNTSVMSKNFSAGIHTVQLSLAHLPAGVYMMEMAAGGEKVKERVVKR